MQRIIRFDTQFGPMWIDLEQVAMVTHGREGQNGLPTIVLKSGQNWTLNKTFTHDLTLAMNAWMDHVNSVEAEALDA